MNATQAPSEKQDREDAEGQEMDGWMLRRANKLLPPKKGPEKRVCMRGGAAGELVGYHGEEEVMRAEKDTKKPTNKTCLNSNLIPAGQWTGLIDGRR